ncbi:MAG: hypothetical protein WBP85_13885 [Terracidiphilus sp.]
MVRHSVRLFLSAVLILLSLPFLAASFLIAAVCALAASALPRFHRRRASEASGVFELHRADPFGFENAVSAYEDLIGAHAWKRP